MSEVIEAYEACKMTKELKALAEEKEKKMCADFESALKLAYPQYRVLCKIIAVLEDKQQSSRSCFSDPEYYGLVAAIRVIEQEIKTCKKEILEVERLASKSSESIDWQERDR